MEPLILAASSVSPELAEWLKQAEGRAVVTALELDSQGRVVLMPLPEVDARLVPRVLKSMAQYAEVLRRLA